MVAYGIADSPVERKKLLLQALFYPCIQIVN